MLKWLIGVSVCLAANPVIAQPGRPDTVSFSFQLTDGQRGDTVYLHPAGPTTLRRFYNKNIRGIYFNDITPVLGTVIVLFYVDSTGKFTGACYEDSTDPLLALEVLRVTRRLSQLPLVPTRVGGKPVASGVRLKVIFQMGSDSPPKDLTADLTITLYEVVH
jgi:hypothetical protein